MDIRPATPADADAIARLHVDSWRRTYRGMMPDEFLDGEVERDRLAVWRERLGTPAANQRVLVADDRGEIQGFICAFGDDDERWGTLIDNLHVRHDLHRSGVGRLLMREAAAWSEATYPGRGLYLWVMQANENAQRFYERIGGSNEGAAVRENPDGSPAHVYRIAWPSAKALTM